MFTKFNITINKQKKGVLEKPGGRDVFCCFSLKQMPLINFISLITHKIKLSRKNKSSKSKLYQPIYVCNWDSNNKHLIKNQTSDNIHHGKKLCYIIKPSCKISYNLCFSLDREIVLLYYTFNKDCFNLSFQIS